jgi:RND family efflux transporter MFP subunit
MDRLFVASVACGGLLFMAPVASSAHSTPVSFDCVMNPSMRLKIGSPVATTLRTIEVERGDHVTRGQVIARLESAVEAADVDLQAERAANTADVTAKAARAEFAKSEDQRGEKLLETNNIPRQKVEELRTQLRVAQEDLQISLLNHRIDQLELARAKAALELRIIRAPINGVVVQRLLGPGEYVHQDAQIVELAQIHPLHVEAYPPVRYFGAIRIGAKAEVRPDLPDAHAFPATVSIADQVFDAGSGTFGVRLDLPNPDDALPAGLRCRVTIETADVPADAVVTQGPKAVPTR